MSRSLQVARNFESGQKHATATAGANTNAVLTIAAEADEIHVLDMLWFSYTDGTAGASPVGRITISIGGTVVFDHDITSSGPGPLRLHGMNGGKANEEVVVTLYAGGADVVGKLSVQYW